MSKQIIIDIPLTRKQVLENERILMAYLSQPRAELFLMKNELERRGAKETCDAMVLIDSAIRSLTFLIGDGKHKM